MRRWIGVAAALYPRRWREEYGEEFRGLLDDLEPSWRVLGDVVRGAMAMQMRRGTAWWKLAAGLAAAGALAAGAISFRALPAQYVSRAVMQMRPAPDPLRPASPEALEARAADRLAQMDLDVLSRSNLAGLIQKLDLYRRERYQMPMEDIVQKMRGDIRIETLPVDAPGLKPIVVRISFAYPDRGKAQETTQALAAQFAQHNAMVNRSRASLYEYFWRDEARAGRVRTVPPPPVGEDLAVVSPASLPESAVNPNRVGWVAAGFGAGTLLGLLAALARQRKRGGWLLAASAAAGLTLALAASFLLPDRFTSTAVMRVSPAWVTEDPLATPPAVSAAQVLDRLGPRILTDENLARIILRVEMYRKLRAREPMEQAVATMRRDLRIAAEPPQGVAGGAGAFRISFSYSDRYKAQQAVREFVTMFTERNVMEQREQAAFVSATQRDIAEHKAAENLEVLDPASLPEMPVAPNRAAIALGGMAAGLLLGARAVWRRRTRPPVLQPA